MKDYDFIWYGARQGGHVAYLPDLEQGKMITVEEAAVHWPDEPVPEGTKPADMKPKVPHLGGGKLDAAWLEDKYKWRDEAGVPLKANFKEMKN